MLKALVWKEYREQLPVALAGMGISLVLPLVVVSMVAATMTQADPMDMADVLRFVLALMVWPIFAAAIGATAFAGDQRDANLGFLLSRPVARGWIWLAKTMTGLVAVTAVVAISWLVSRTFDLVIAGASMRPSLSGGLLSGSEHFVGANVMALIALTFSLSIYFSGIFDRSMTAAVAGLAAGFGLVMLTDAYWRAVWQAAGGFGRRTDARIVVILLGSIIGATLLVTLLAFARGELMERRPYRRRLLLGALVIVLIFVVGTQALLFAETRLDPSYALLSSPRLAPNGEGVIVDANRENGRAPQLWLLGFDGGITRLTRRLTYFRSFLEDGRSILYESRRGWLGFPSGGREMRTVRLDGSGDRLFEQEVDFHIVYGSRLYAPRGVSSPDGRLEARLDFERSRYRGAERRVFVITTKDGDEVERLDSDEVGYTWAWRADSSGIVFIRRRPLTLTFYDLATKQFSDLAQYPDVRDEYARWSGLPDTVSDRVRLVRWDTFGNPKELIRAVDEIDLDSGEISTLFEVRGRGIAGDGEWHCPVYEELSPDRDRFLYTTCEVFPHSPQRTRATHLHAVDLESGEDRVWTTIESTIVWLTMSPSADRLLAAYLMPLADPERDLAHPDTWEWRKVSAVIEPDGSQRVLDEGWLAVYWMDSGRALVAYIPGVADPGLNFVSAMGLPFAQLAVLDVVSGDREVFYP